MVKFTACEKNFSRDLFCLIYHKNALLLLFALSEISVSKPFKNFKLEVYFVNHCHLEMCKGLLFQLQLAFLSLDANLEN
jgi:hypothetical protein